MLWLFVSMAAKHLLYARCGGVGLIAGGDELTIVGRKRRYTEEEIETASRKCWEYWKEYWKNYGSGWVHP